MTHISKAAFRAGPATAALFTAALSAQAAEITAHRYQADYEDGPGAYIFITGETERGDYQRFLNAMPEAIALHGSRQFPIDVWLEGPGGDLDEALRLGRLIYDLGFFTLVDANEECASACALIWLGGARLFMKSEARVGFHQAYDSVGTASVTGNALVGHYMSEVGLSASVVRYVMTAEPGELEWLRPDQLESIGLPVTVLE